MNYDVAIIGTGGAIATSLVKQLSHVGCSVIGFGRTSTDCDFVKFDVCQNSKLKQKRSAKTVIYNAVVKGRFADESEEARKQNAVNAPNLDLLFENLNLDCDRIVTMGSSEEYGPKDTSTEISEGDPAVPISSYGKSKVNLFQNAARWSDECGKSHLHLRIFNVFGAGADPKMFVQSLISSLLKNSQFEMTKGEQWRSFISISLLTEYIIKLIGSESWRHQLINVSTENYFQLRSVVEILAEIIPIEKVQLGALPYRTDEIWHQKPNLDILKNFIGLAPKENFRTALNDTVQYLKAKELSE